MTAVVGREHELSEVARLLSAARERYAGLVLEGEAGIGKTTVWREALRLGDEEGFRVVSCRPARAEARLAFASLADLLASVEDELFSRLPEPQREALEVALLRAVPGDSRIDARAVATALTSVLTALAETSPLLIAIDDAQWLDRASAAALTFALRRLGPRSPTALLVTVRIDPARRAAVLGLEQLPPGRLERLRLGPLHLGGLYHALRDQLRLVLPRPVLQRVQTVSGGNPLFALEIGRVLVERGVPPVGEPLPVPADVGALLRRRVRKLPAASGEVVLAAALLADPRAEIVRAALGRAIDSDLETAERHGIAAVDGDRIAFSHPLLAAAVGTSATSSERRRMHRRLAGALPGGEAHARHLALATSSPDEGVAAVVHAAAAGAAARGAPGEAAELVELALRLTEPGSDEQPQRVLDLADYLHAAGELERARALLGSIEGSDRWPPQLRADALELIGDLGTYAEPPAALSALFERALRDPLPPRARAVAHLGLSYNVGMFDAARALEHAEVGLALMELAGHEADPATLAAALATYSRARLVRGHGLDPELVDRALALESRLPPERALAAPFGFWFKWIDDLEASRRWLTRYLDRTSGSGYEMFRAVVSMHLADVDCLAGDLPQARRRALSAFGFAAELGAAELRTLTGATLARIEARLGNASEARGLARQLLPEVSGAAGKVIDLEGTLGLLDLATDDHRGADEHLRRAVERFDRAGYGEPAQFRVHADAAEAAVGVGDLERAERIADLLEEHGTRTGRRWSLAAGGRARALVAAARADLEGALAAAERARSWHDELPMPFELGRTLLVEGRIERRVRQRARAKASFEQALAIFERMGARLWAERARAEIGRVGLRRSSGDELTESERRVAELTARGRTRREVAAALHVSPKTVDATLVRVYRKLGVHSRAELGARMAALVQK